MEANQDYLSIGTKPIVYLLRAGDTNSYKVGITQDIKNRLSQIQTGSPIKIEVVYTHEFKTIDSARIVENKVHKILSSHRLHGEWFELRTKKDVNLVTEIIEAFSDIIYTSMELVEQAIQEAKPTIFKSIEEHISKLIYTKYDMFSVLEAKEEEPVSSNELNTELMLDDIASCNKDSINEAIETYNEINIYTQISQTDIDALFYWFNNGILPTAQKVLLYKVYVGDPNKITSHRLGKVFSKRFGKTVVAYFDGKSIKVTKIR